MTNHGFDGDDMRTQTVDGPLSLRDVPAEPEFNPVAALFRLMRGRWTVWFLLCCLLGGGMGWIGYARGEKLYESQAILRIYPKEQSILYERDDSVLKTYDSFVKAETTFVASHLVMSRAFYDLAPRFPEILAGGTQTDLALSIRIKRKESLIILTTLSRDPEFAQAKLQAVVDAYLSLTEEAAGRQTALRSETLRLREEELMADVDEISREILEVGGEYGPTALRKAHSEKIGQIDEAAARLAEVSSTLEALRVSEGATSSADTNDPHIMRATLLDRSMADLNLEKTRYEADLSASISRYPEGSPNLAEVRGRIDVVDRAIAERRRQIQVLGQTGALTDQRIETKEASMAAIQKLHNKVSLRLAVLRAEARALNERRIELSFLETRRIEAEKLLTATHKAVDALHLESKAALLGLIEVMQAAVYPVEYATDSDRKNALIGLVLGGTIASILVFGSAITHRRLRYSDDLWHLTHLVPIVGALSRSQSRREDLYDTAINRLRNRTKLAPARVPRPIGRGRVLSIGRLEQGYDLRLVMQISNSFASANMDVLLVDADLVNQGITTRLGLDGEKGWGDFVTGAAADTTPYDGYHVLPCGTGKGSSDQDFGLYEVSAAVAELAQEWDVVLIHFGSVIDNVAAELVLTASDYCLAQARVGDRLHALRSGVELVDRLPRNGGGLWVEGLQNHDPHFAPRTAPLGRSMRQVFSG
jgi:hypothetical protein